VRLSGLNLFPIKSCRGIAVPQAEVTRRGLARDRRWMIVDESGAFMTQRDYPEMTHVRTALDGETLVLRHRERGELRLPVSFDAGARRDVQVWSSRVAAVAHDEGSAWVSAALGRRCQLVYMPDDVERAVNPLRGRPGDVVSFADAYPFLLIGQGSLDDLNGRMSAPLPMTRFRPNLVVEGSTAFAEDGWPRVRVGAVTFRNVKPCDRCVLTTVDPETGTKGPEPLRTLATYRAWDGAVWFGVNLIAENTGALRVGDPVEPL
jgi:uncharacterized protein